MQLFNNPVRDWAEGRMAGVPRDAGGVSAKTSILIHFPVILPIFRSAGTGFYIFGVSSTEVVEKDPEFFRKLGEPFGW